MTNPWTAAGLCAAVSATAISAIAAEAKVITFAPGVETPARITLLPRQGKEGRDNPFYDNYRPQIQFTAGPQPVTCAVRVPTSLEKVEPGQTAEVALNCSEKFRSLEADRSFVVLEGGRKVATGTLR